MTATGLSAGYIRLEICALRDSNRKTVHLEGRYYTYFDTYYC